MVRLDKFLADQGIGTRSQVKDIVKKGRVKIDGEIVKAADLKFDPEKSVVMLDDTALTHVSESYYMMNKPDGVVCANSDSMHQTVFELMDVPYIKNLFCVGRLDIDTEGLLIITDDGDLSHKLLSPKKHVEKTYYLEVDSPVIMDAEKIIAEGFQVDDELFAAPGKYERIDDFKGYLTITEGKFHQVKRMMSRLGSEVTFLKRVKFGGLDLDTNLEPGEYRSLSKEEIEILKSSNR